MNMQNLMAQAQKMQKEIMSKKEIINKQEFTGDSELISVVVNGKKEVLAVNIKNKESFDMDDLDILQDMFVIATNDAFKQVDATVDKEMGQYGSSLNGLL